MQKARLEESQHEVLGRYIHSFLSELNRQVELGQAATDQDYVMFQRTVTANVRSGPLSRNHILLRKLFQYSPGFYTEVAQTNQLAAELREQIDSSAKAIRILVTQANENYASEYGEDLFKPTNRTVGALSTALNRIPKNYDGYKDLVDNLYFLFRESVGRRLEGNMPSSFQDVNDLRTLNEHDVDHGKASRVKKKRKSLGDVFRRYSGEASPSAIDPGKFVVVHSNLLAALEHDLRMIVKTGFKS